MSELRLFIPIGKVDAAKRIVYGTLTAEIPDKSGEVFDYASGKPAIQAWSDEIKEASGGKSLGNVRAMHGNTAAGKFTDIVYDDAAKRIEGAAKIVDDDEWRKVEEGVYTGFSIGGSYTKRWQDPNNSSLWRFTPKLSEISLVDNPCVGSATFQYIKADGSVEMRKFTPSHKEDSMDPKALAAAKEALAKGTATDEQKALLAQETAELLKAAQDADAKGEATDEQKALIKAAAGDSGKVALVKDGKAVKPKTAPVQKWLAEDGTPFDSKREAEVHNLGLEKQAELAPGLDKMDALLKGSKKPADDEDEDAEGDDEDTKKAKKSRRDEKAAKAEEKAEKDDAEMAAKAKKDKEAADKAAKPGDLAETTPALEKGLHQVGWLAHLLSDLQSLQNSVAMEQYFEGDSDSELPAKFKSLVSEMCEVLVTLVEEETSELTEGDDTDVEILQMAAKVDSAHASALGKFIAAMKPYDEAELKKPEVKAHVNKLIALKAALEKAGARHSKSDMEKFGEMHKMVKDHADAISKMADDHCDAMGKCMKDAGMIPDRDDDEDDMEPSGKGAKKMSKLLDSLEAERDNNAALTKVLASTNERLEKAIPFIEGLQKTNADLVTRMEHLEKQPAAAKGHVRAVSKAEDSGVVDDAAAKAQREARMAKMSPMERSREEMKKAMSRPMELSAL